MLKNKFFVISVVVFLCLSMLPFQSICYGKRMALISVNTDYKEEYSSYLYELLLTEIVNTNSFEIVSRKDLKNVREEKKLHSFDVAKKEAINLARRLEADVILIPRIVNISTEFKEGNILTVTKSRYNSEVEITTKIINVQTANVLQSIYSQGTGRQSYENGDNNKNQKQIAKSQSIKKAIKDCIKYNFQPKFIKSMNLNVKKNQIPENGKENKSGIISISSIASLLLIIFVLLQNRK